MIRPSEPIHPLTTAIILTALWVSITASAAARYGVRAGIAVGLVLPIAAVIAFGVYEMWTLPADDPRWGDYAEAMNQERERDPFRYP